MFGCDVNVQRTTFGSIWYPLANPGYMCKLMGYSESCQYGDISLVKPFYTIQWPSYLGYCSVQDDPSHLPIATSYQLHCQAAKV